MRVGITALITSLSAAALPAEQTIPRSHQYPSGKTVQFTSWSLFLVCDSAWLRSEGKTELVALYNAYLNLVTTANENDAPLWAFRRPAGWRAEEIDPIWSKPYCDSLGLASRTGPFLVITVHPPDSIRPSDAKVLIAFGNRPAMDIVASLNAFGEQASANGLADARAGSSEWWSAWDRLSSWSRGRFPGATMAVQANRERKR